MSNQKKQIISSESDDLISYLKKIWLYRQLIVSFAIRDIKSKYAQTILGLGWTLLQPITGIIIFTFFFEYILHMKIELIPYPIFAFLGYITWNLFANIFQQGSTSIFDQRNLLSKIYFPKIILPLSKVISCSFDFILTISLLIILIPFYRIDLSWSILFIPIFYLIQIIFSLSCAVILSVLTLKKRDLFHIIPYIINFGIWATPVFYSIDIFPQKWIGGFNFNPIALCIEGYRACMFENYVFQYSLLWSLPIVMILLIISLILINKSEDKFAEIL